MDDLTNQEWRENKKRKKAQMTAMQALPSLDGNTVTYIKDGQIKRITCGRKEEAQELFEEVKNVQK